MKKRGAIWLILVFFTLGLAGCATTRKENNMELQGLKNQVSVLEAQLQSRDEEINGLRDALNNATAEKIVTTKKIKVIKETKSHPSDKQVQAALVSAGYYSGKIDGRIGKQTKDAIKAFQKANSLTPDGRAGKQTWAVLAPYLDKKIK